MVHVAGLQGLMGPNREITDDQWLNSGDHVILFETQPTDNILMDIQTRLDFQISNKITDCIVDKAIDLTPQYYQS